MNVKDIICPERITKKRISQYIHFSEEKGYSLEWRDTNPVWVIEWILQVVKTEGFSIFESQRYKDTFYFLIKESKYPLSLFIKLAHIEKLIKNCKVVNIYIFEDLFNLFLNASKCFATNRRGKELIRNMPEELPLNRKPYKGWFLTDTNECFKMLSVIDFYIWLDQNSLLTTTLKDPERLQFHLDAYLLYMKANYSRGKYKKKRIFISYVKKLLKQKEVYNNVSHEFTSFKPSRMLNLLLRYFRKQYLGSSVLK